MDYNKAMAKIYGICLLVFLAVWGLGVFFTYLAGFQHTSFSGPENKTIDGKKIRIEQEEITTQTKKEYENIMDTYEFDRQRFYRQQGKTHDTRF